MIIPSHIDYLSYATTIIILVLLIACELGLKMNIELMGIQIQYEGGEYD